MDATYRLEFLAFMQVILIIYLTSNIFQTPYFCVIVTVIFLGINVTVTLDVSKMFENDIENAVIFINSRKSLEGKYFKRFASRIKKMHNDN